MTVDCLLVADDLTGAADACAKFVASGCAGAVQLTLGTHLGLDADVDIDLDALAINVDTRRLEVHEARRRIREAARLVVEAGMRPAVVFKKIDSTLRGHVGAELNEALAAFDCTHAIFAPSFPAMGRIVRDGTLMVAHTAAPALQHDIATVLAEQGVPDAVCVRAGDMATTNARVLICDAVTQPDLDAVVRAMSARGGRPLWVGSAGLAQALATHLASARTRVCQQPPLPLLVPAVPPAPTPAVLLFIGSPHAVTREQVTHLLHTHDVIHTRDSESLREALGSGRGHHLLVTGSKRSATAKAATRDDAAGHHRAASADPTGALAFNASTGSPAAPAPVPKAATAAALAAMDAIVDAARRRMLAGFVMSGGDTAADVCRVLGADRLRLGGEVADGIPWGILQGGPASGVPLVLKSGGFGHPDALTACVDFLMTRPVCHVHP